MTEQEQIKKATMTKLKQEQSSKKEESSLKIPSALLTHQAKAGLEKKIDMNNLFKSNKRVAWLPSYATPNMLEILKERDAVKREREKMIQEEIIAKKNDAEEEERKRRKVKEIMLKLNLNKPQSSDTKKRKHDGDNEGKRASSEKKPKNSFIENDTFPTKTKKTESEVKKANLKKVKSTVSQPISFEQLMKQAEENKNKPIEDQDFLDSINSCGNDIIFKKTIPNAVKTDLPNNMTKLSSNTPNNPIKSNTTNNPNKINKPPTDNIKKDCIYDKLKKDSAKKVTNNQDNTHYKNTSNSCDGKLITKKFDPKESSNNSKSVRLKTSTNGKVDQSKVSNGKDIKKQTLMEKMLGQLREIKNSGLDVENFIDDLKSFVSNNNKNNNTTNNKNKNTSNEVKMKESASIKKASESLKSKSIIPENKANIRDTKKIENIKVKSKPNNKNILNAWDRMMMERGIKTEPISHNKKKKHVDYEEEEEDEDEYEDDFVDDEADEDDEYAKNFSSHIKDIFKYNRYRYPVQH